MRKITNILFWLPALLLAACTSAFPDNPWERETAILSIRPQYPESFPTEEKSKGTLRLSSRREDLSYECAADKDGVFSITLPKGSYRAVYNLTYESYIFNGVLDKIILGSSDTDIDLPLSVSKAGSLVIKEIYCGGCTKYPEEGNYASDSYIIVHNNSSQTEYLDSLCLGVIDPYRSIATNVWSDMDIDYVPVVQAIWQIGGTGRSFPLESGEDAVIVIYGAIDHAATYSQSVNLNKEDYFVCYSTAYFPNPNYHPAPGDNIQSERILSVVIKTGQANAYTFAQASPAPVIFRAPQGTTVQEFLQNGESIIQKPGSSVDRIVKLPIDWVIDGVEVFEKAGKNKKRLPSAIDAGAVDFSGPYQGHTLCRKTDEKSTSLCGYMVLQDTNNSTDDFYEREIQSLHE